MSFMYSDLILGPRSLVAIGNWINFNEKPNLEVAEVANLLELAGHGDCGSLLDDLLPGEVDIRQADSNLPVAALTCQLSSIRSS